MQVGMQVNGVKNLFVVRGKKKMESTAADSLIIVCFVEVSQSCRQKRHHGAHVTFQRQVGWVGTGRALAACACFGAGSQESPGTDVHVNYLVNSAGTFQSVSAVSLLLWGCLEAADPPVARTELWPELQGAALQCHLGVSAGSSCLLHQWHGGHMPPQSGHFAFLSVLIARAVCRCQEQTFPSAPSPSCSTLIPPGIAHTWGYCLLPHPLSNSEELSDSRLKQFCCISLQISFLYGHQLLILFSACLF